MAWFRSRERDLVSTDVLARYGRAVFLGPDVSDASYTETFEWVAPLREAQFMGDDSSRERAIAEVRRHSTAGGWAAVGAWKYARDMVGSETFGDEMAAGGLRAIEEMQVTNLGIHLSPLDSEVYHREFGHRPPHDGFFGPPTFASASMGPTREDYFAKAIAASAARSPQRVAHRVGVAPPEVEDEQVASVTHDLGMLVLRGPLLVSADTRFEANVVRPLALAATDVDHTLFAERLVAAVERLDQQQYRSSWTPIGAARFVEDYLAPELTGNAAHMALVQRAVHGLHADGLINFMFPAGTLSWTESSVQ